VIQIEKSLCTKPYIYGLYRSTMGDSNFCC